MSDGVQSAFPRGIAAVSGGDPSPEAEEPGSGGSGLRRPYSQRPPASRARVERPLPRWRDVHAEVPTLRAQLRRAERKRDVERERLIAAALARALVKRRAELDIAVRLARRAVLLGEDALRMELAAWHCQLGQTALAVGMLVPLLESPGLDRARLSMRIALYWARLGHADDALAALREAAAYDPEDPLIHELQATVHGWAPRTTSASSSAEAYLRGAERRAKRRDHGAAFQDLLRAFDTAPELTEAAASLAAAFVERSQAAIADEVWRRHGDALIDAGQADRGCAVHRQRLSRFLAARSYEEALAAAFDARLDAAVDARALLALLSRAPPLGAGEQGQREQNPIADGEETFDALLLELGLFELLAARLELAAEAAQGELSSRCHLALGNLIERAFGNTERAIESWTLAVVASPESEEARAALRRYAASTGDYTPLVEALIRVTRPDAPASASRGAGCLEELRQLAEERFNDPALALWCVRRALHDKPDSPDLLERERALAEPAAEAQRALDAALARLETLDGDERVSVLRQAAAALRGFPDRAEQYRVVLLELESRRPDELRFRRLVETLMSRLGDSDGLSRLWTRDLVSATDPGLSLRALTGLSRLERLAGNLQGSLAVLAADDGRGLGSAAGMQLALAAQLGNRRLRAEGLLKVSAGLSPTLRAWLASIASSELVLLGELPAALRAAEIGTHSDPSATRPIVAYATAAEGKNDRVAAVAYERAMALTFPSSEFCRRLVAVLEGLGEHYAAQVWTGRWLGLRPAETAAATQLLRGSAKAGDAARLGDVVSWTVSQAHPLAGWAEPLANALTCLAEVDRSRAAEVAWRVLDAFGPEPPALKHAVLVVASESGDLELQIAVIERELAADGSGSGDALWRLAELHAERGEPDRSCAVLVRALAAGLDPRRVLTLLTSLPEASSPEGEFYRLEVRASALELLGDKSEECWQALREYGAALWDLARDQSQAVEVWLRAAELGKTEGWFHFAQDLVEVLGLERALDEVCRLAETREAPDQVAALLTGAAVVSKNRGSRRRALQLGLLALDTEPGNVWALEIIEEAAVFADLPSVESAYKAALRAVLGSYGERALHYRAARFFERSGEPSLALTHAIAAFRAVPSEGVTFALMLRLSQGAKEAERVARAIEEVAQSQPSGQLRSAWLRRAALVAGRTADGVQQRTEVLLRALLAHPDTETVDLLGRAFTDLARQQPEGRAIGLLRFSRAVTKLLPRLDPMESSRVAISMASVALSCFSDARLALTALGGAVKLDPDADDFGEFVAEVPRLVTDAEAAKEWLATVDVATDKGVRGSPSLLELAADTAAALGQSGMAASLLARRVALDPENAALRAKAELALQKNRDTSLPEHVLALFPVHGRLSELIARAELANKSGDKEAELAALEEAFQIELKLPLESLTRLLDLAAELGKTSVAEQVLGVARQSDMDPEAVAQATLALSAQLVEQRRPQRALKLLREASEHAPADVALWTQALSAARAAGDDDQRQDILSKLVELTQDTVKKSFFLNEAWEVAKKRGQPELATDILRRWLAADPEDTRALSRLEAECEAREDWDGLVELLGRHLALGVSFRERRRLVLRRAELLEQKLGRLDEAQKELSALVEQAPADRTVVERLAQVSEAIGDRNAAAANWFVASGLSSTRPAAAGLAERACRLYLDTGEVMSARRVLAAPQTLPRTLGLAKLAVRLERDGENEPRLARALEELARVDEQPVAERAAAMLEACALWRRLGDEERALECASSAALWVPDDLDAQILASYHAYRRRGPKSREEAEASIMRLSRMLDRASGEQLDLAAFLLAEALDVVEGGDAGLDELVRLMPRVGSSPLMSAGLAERLARGPSPQAALEHFDAALGGGDLHGLRKPSRLALEAAQAAKRAGLAGAAHRYAKLAEADPELAEAVARLREELLAAPAQSSAPRQTVAPGQGLGQAPKSEPRAAAAPVSPFAAAARQPEDLEVQTRPARRTQIGLGRTDPRYRATEPGGNLVAPGVAPFAQVKGAAPRVEAKAEARQDAKQDVDAKKQEPSGPKAAPAPKLTKSALAPVRSLELPRAREFKPTSPVEKTLFEKLGGGSLAAGHELCEKLLTDARRADDAVAVAWLMVRAEPGDRTALTDLERAASAAGDLIHAQAVAHVRHCTEDADAPPDVEHQLVRSDVARKLLFSEADGQWPKALEVIWESTRRVLQWERARDLESAERVSGDEASPLAACYFPMSRLLGLAETPLLRIASPTDYRVNVVMLGEPSVVVRGQVEEDSASLRYDLGAALAGTLPPYAIINAATYEQIDDLFRAVHGAFGPPEASQTTYTSTARLAALLWESLPPRTQRQMTEWCRDGKLTRELAAASARRAARRAGLFACGDLAVALNRVLADEAIPIEVLDRADGLARLCSKSRAAADLVRLACDPLYAHLRWQPKAARPGGGLTRRGL